MERHVAVKKLRKLLGPSLGYRVNLKAPDHDDRVEAREALKATSLVRDDLAKQKEARMQALLQGDAEYQQLKAAHKEVKDRCHELSRISMTYRFTAGTCSDLFFHVMAEGDSWEEVIATITKRKTGT